MIEKPKTLEEIEISTATPLDEYGMEALLEYSKEDLINEAKHWIEYYEWCMRCKNNEYEEHCEDRWFNEVKWEYEMEEMESKIKFIKEFFGVNEMKTLKDLVSEACKDKEDKDEVVAIGGMAARMSIKITENDKNENSDSGK